MRIKCYYNKNLKMSPPKLAAQVGHACMGVDHFYMNHYGTQPNYIVVLGVTATKMNKIRDELESNGTRVYTQVDLGLTEVPARSETVIAHREG